MIATVREAIVALDIRIILTPHKIESFNLKLTRWSTRSYFMTSAVIVVGEVAAFMIAREFDAVGAKDSMTQKATIVIGETAFTIATGISVLGEIASTMREAISFTPSGKLYKSYIYTRRIKDAAKS